MEEPRAIGIQENAVYGLSTSEGEGWDIHQRDIALNRDVDQIAFDKDVWHQIAGIGSTVRTTRDRLFAFGISVIGFDEAGSAIT